MGTIDDDLTVNHAIARSYWDAEESRDITRITGHFVDDAVFVAPGWTLRGVEDVARYYRASADLYPTLEVKITSELTDHDESCFEWDAVLTGADGVTHRLLGVNRMWFRDGRIAVIHAYYDAAALPSQAGDAS